MQQSMGLIDSMDEIDAHRIVGYDTDRPAATRSLPDRPDRQASSRRDAITFNPQF